jgi:hypothetical protein
LISASSSGVRSCPCCKTAWSIAAGTKCSSLPLITKSQFFSLGIRRQSATFRVDIVFYENDILIFLRPLVKTHQHNKKKNLSPLKILPRPNIPQKELNHYPPALLPPHEESNLDLLLRREPFYPLNYGERKGESATKIGSMESQRSDLCYGVALPPYNALNFSARASRISTAFRRPSRSIFMFCATGSGLKLMTR